ncbi:UNVERIFIED_CONTAM: hypothetical protein Sangu_2631900 [Sesamum angustifolium]|uniref:Uncharacterized protein n=1 Tax=Sesamum angustifolium TaxID=2727405 RepID=A0AAW2J389_9LAMI
MQLARQGKISLEEDSTARNVITIESGHVDGNKDSCNATHGDNITSNEDTLFKKEDSSDTDDCMSTITSLTKICFLGTRNPIDELSNSRLMIQGFQSRRTKGCWHYKNAIDYGGHGVERIIPCHRRQDFLQHASRSSLITRGRNLRESVFNRLGPHRKELHGIANRKSVFDRLGPCKRVRHQKKCAFKVAVRPKKTSSLHINKKLRSLIPSRMKRQTTLTISCGRVLKAKAQTMIFTQVQSDDEDDKESVASSNYVSNSVEENIAQTYHITLIEDGEVQEEDAENAPAELEEGSKATIDELKEVNPRPIYLSASLIHGEEGTYIALLNEFKDVFAWSYKEMPGLDPKIVVHHLSVKKGARPVKQGQCRF